MGAIWNGEAVVVRQVRVAPQCWKMTLEVPGPHPVDAGQFCHIRTEAGTEPLLRRPFSYWDLREGGDRVAHADLLYTVVGRGTAALEAKRPGSKVGYLGPLGIGFTARPAGTWVLVAGGVGIVPFFHLARQARARGLKPRILLLFGGRSEAMLYGIDEFAAEGVEAKAATEDGSRGRKGLVTDLLEEELRGLGREGLQLYTCGPERMMEAVIRIARREKLPCEASLEKRMGCALGACGACVQKVTADDGRDWRYSRICIEGPAYDACRLVLE
jgi:dihydroorotate dehydrogenase electron transfer subunit